MAAFTVNEYASGLEGTVWATVMIPVLGAIVKTAEEPLVIVYSDSALGPISSSAADTIMTNVPSGAPGATVAVY